MTSDTPLTDANQYKADTGMADDYLPFMVSADFARQLERELNALRWIPITERLPTIEDGNEFEDVEWSDGKSIREGHYQNRKGETHWRRITLP